ncbi:MAG: PAS domain S-box protein [Elusimicrobia bacterium]|nr:PAS domain S-box protein [Elusimicrobiota bacterium]
MRHPETASLSGRLLAWILPTFLLAAVAISVTAYAIARTLLMREMEREVQVMTEIAAGQVRAFHEQRVNDLATIAQSPLFRDHFKNVEFGLAHEAGMYLRDIDRMLLDFSRRAGVYVQLRYVDAAGRDLSRVEGGRVRPGARGPDAAAVAGLRRGVSSTSGLVPAARGGPPEVEARHGLFDDTGRLRGALAFRWSLARVIGQLARLRIGDSGRSYLLHAGKPLARWAGRAEGPVVTSRLDIPGTPWSAWTVVRRAEFLDRLRWLGKISFLLAVSTIALLAVVVTRLVRTLLRPIATLAGAAEAYAKGRLDVRVDAGGPREVAALANSFNEMAESLRLRTDDLEQRVRELTALQSMNDAVLRRLGRREIARLCLESAAKGLGFRRGALYWVDEEAEEAVGECVAGAAAPSDEAAVCLRRLGFEESPELADSVRGRRVVAGLREGPSSLLPGGLSGHRCVVPILGRNRVLAVMALDGGAEGGQACPQRARGAALFGGSVGLALENSGLLEDLVRSESRYRTAVENSPDAVIGLDQHMRVTLWNRRAEALFGYQPSEAYGRTLEFLFAPEAYAALKRQVETQGAIRQAEARGVTRDGRSLELSVSWTGQNGPLAGLREWFVVIQDETHKKRLQGQLIQSEKLSAVGTLLAGVVHEINNPLQQDIGLSELLKDPTGNPQGQDDVRKLQVAAVHCRSMVRGLLAFVRKDSPELHRVSLNAVVEETIAVCEYRSVKSEGIQLEVELDPSRPQVAAEFHKLQQVLLNLIVNARDALQRFGPRVLRVRTRRIGERCETEVEDNGPGVARELRERLFQPFFTTKPRGKGTGLGLSISKEIIESFGGTLRYEDAPEGGARFVFSLPPCPAEITETDEAIGLPPPTPGKRVLAVDDEEGVLRVMRRILQEDGLVVDATIDGADALRRLATGSYDLVVTDVELGPVKGTELSRAALAAPSPPAVVLVTGDILNDELKGQLTRLGAVVLAKPFLRTEFLRTVRNALRDGTPRPRR